MPTEVQFINEVHNVNKIPIDTTKNKLIKKKALKEYKTNNKQ
jgi:hypothetical protein